MSYFNASEAKRLVEASKQSDFYEALEAIETSARWGTTAESFVFKNKDRAKEAVKFFRDRGFDTNAIKKCKYSVYKYSDEYQVTVSWA